MQPVTHKLKEQTIFVKKPLKCIVIYLSQNEYILSISARYNTKLFTIAQLQKPQVLRVIQSTLYHVGRGQRHDKGKKIFYILDFESDMYIIMYVPT